MNGKWWKKTAVLCLFMLVLTAHTALAGQGSNGKGAAFPRYKKTVVLTMKDPNILKKLGYGSNSYQKKHKLSVEEFLDAAISVARRKASTKVRYKIVVPPGKYKDQSLSFDIPSNTVLYAKGAVFTYRRGMNPFYGMGKSNILIQGGTWDFSKITPGGSTLIPVCNRKNIAFKNVTIKGNCLAHIMEFADVKGLTLSGCRFSGNQYDETLQPKEAVELDVAEMSACPPASVYNGKGCHNVLIEKCTFQKVARGVGSHNYLTGSVKIENPSFRNVTIRNNTFKNCSGEAIFLMNMKNVTVSGNKVTSAKRTGIFIENCRNVLAQKNHVSKITAFTGEREIYGPYKAALAVAASYGLVIKNNVLSKTPGGTACYYYGPKTDQGVTESGNLVK